MEGQCAPPPYLPEILSCMLTHLQKRARTCAYSSSHTDTRGMMSLDMSRVPLHACVEICMAEICLTAHVCTRVCMHIHACACVGMCVHPLIPIAHACACTCVHVLVIRVYPCACIHTRVLGYTCMCVRVCMCMHAHACACVYISQRHPEAVRILE